MSIEASRYIFYPYNPPAENYRTFSYFTPDEYPDIALTADECDALIAYAKAIDPHPGFVGAYLNVDEKIRSVVSHETGYNADTAVIHDKMAAAFNGANDHWWQFDIWGMGPIELLHYTPGGHYVMHLDHGPRHQVRKLSGICQLSDPEDYEGGTLEIVVGETDVHQMPKQRGTIVVFPSYMLHRVHPVTAGERWASVIWAEGPKYR